MKLDTGEVDWVSQWQLFSPVFFDGKAKIDLQEKGIFYLIPGPGFGDLSHPTTRLMLRLLRLHAKEKNVFDIGCGSGILTLAAYFMGAHSAAGIDIDEKAVEHSKKNASINGLENKVFFSQKLIPSSTSLLIAMNMIFSEQKIAWQESFKPEQILTSGILKTERDSYLIWTNSLGWEPQEQLEEEDWLAFSFICKKQKTIPK